MSSPPPPPLQCGVGCELPASLAGSKDIYLRCARQLGQQPSPPARWKWKTQWLGQGAMPLLQNVHLPLHGGGRYCCRVVTAGSTPCR